MQQPLEHAQLALLEGGINLYEVTELGREAANAGVGGLQLGQEL